MKYIDTIVDNLHVYIYIKIDKKRKRENNEAIIDLLSKIVL